MTEAQKKFVELEQKKEEVKRFFEELKIAMEAVSKEIGIGGYFQDDTGTVFKITAPEGRFVNYEKISYVRTKRHGEQRGTLSIKEAEEKGFIVG